MTASAATDTETEPVTAMSSCLGYVFVVGTDGDDGGIGRNRYRNRTGCRYAIVPGSPVDSADHAPLPRNRNRNGCAYRNGNRFGFDSGLRLG